ncbi:MAG: dephospho-CoA kinase [Flavobacteriaceae bacterium]|jgi:dephospho-CoA kinase|tara:strand:+ start:54 stop:647 length:594 start_codon:yes stop_codon:yes gene_type:complete
MIVLGITGGIGSGKTTVCDMFSSIGVPVYNADIEAKKIMESSEDVKSKICLKFGDKAYVGGNLNKNFISEKIFKDKSLLKEINNIVHPEVYLHFTEWQSSQKSLYVVKEVAILFELKTENQFNFILTVTSPEETRIQRIIKRDGKSKELVRSIIDNQLKDSEKIRKSDFVIVNICMEKTLKNVYDIHEKIINYIAKK